MADVQELIRKKLEAAGIDPTMGLAFAKIESNFDPTAGQKSNNPHKGLFQFSPALWDKYGGGKDIYDPEANTDAFVQYHNDYLAPGMQAALGRKATPAEMYLGHQQGVAGGSALINNAAKNVIDTLSPLYGGSGSQALGAVNNNGGDSTMTAGDFANLWGNKFSDAAKGFDPNYDAGTINIASRPDPAMAQDPTTGLLAWGAAQGPQMQTQPSGGLLSALAAMGKSDAAKQTQTGLGLLAAATPKQQQAPQMQAPQAQAHRPQVQAASMPNFIDPLLQQKLYGLLGSA